jgi:hypothetical protein
VVHIDVVVFCGRVLGINRLRTIRSGAEFQPRAEGFRAVDGRLLAFWLCFVTLPTEALLAVLRALRQMLGDKKTAEQLNG